MNIGTLIASLGVDTKGLTQAEKDFAKFGKNIGEKATKLGKSLSLKLTAPLLLMGGIAAKTAIDFESAFTGVRKTVDATEKQFAILKKELKALALEIPLSTEELFGLGEAAGQLGIKQKDILKFTKVMADLGATTNLAANEAATSLARFANITGLASDDYGRLGSTIVELGNNLATTEREIVEMSMRLAGAGTIAGMTQPQILALAGALSSVGIRAEAGGTAFSRVMKEISKQVGTGSEAMKVFATVSGQSVAEFEKQWKENAAKALISFTEGLGKIQKSGENVNLVLDELGFSNVRISDSLLRAAVSGDLFREALELGSKAWKENTALTKEANLRYATSASRLKIAKNQVAQLAESFGAVLVPAILKVVELLKPVVTWLKNLDESTKTVIVVIAGLTAIIGPLLIALGAMVTAIKALHIIGIFKTSIISFIVFVQALTVEFGLLQAATLSVSTAFSILAVALGGLILGYAVGTWAADWVWGLDKIKDKMKEVAEEQTKLEKRLSRKLSALGFIDIEEFNKAVKDGLVVYSKALGIWEKTADVTKRVGEERAKTEKKATETTKKTFEVLTKIELIYAQFEERKLKQAQKTMFQIITLYENMENSRIKEDLERTKKWLAGREKMQQKFLFFGLKGEELKQAQLKKWYKEELQRLKNLGLLEQQIEGRNLTMREALRNEFTIRMKGIERGLTDYSIAQLQRMLDDEQATVRQREKIWKQINEKIEDSNISLFDAFKLGIRDAADHFNSSAQTMLQAGRNLANGLNQGLSDVFFDVFNEKITDMTESWEKFGDRLRDIFFRAISDIAASLAASGIMEFVTRKFGKQPVVQTGVQAAATGGAVAAVTPGIMDIISKILAGKVGLIATIVVAAIAAINSGLLKKIVRGVVSLVEKLPQMVRELVKKIPELLVDLGDAVLDIIETLPDLLAAILGKLPELLSGIVDKLPEMVQKVLDRLPIILEKFIKLIPTFLKSLLGGIPELIHSIVSVTPEIILKIVEQLPKIVDAVISILGQLLDDLARGITHALGQILDAIVGFFTELPGIIFKFLKEIIGGAIGKGGGIGGDILGDIGGVLGGIGDVFGFQKGGVLPGHFTPVTAMAGGGVYTRPTLGLIAETPTARPEIVSPVSLMDKVVRNAIRTEGGKTIQINAPLVNIEGHLVAGPTEFRRFVKNVRTELTRITKSEF